MLLETRIPVTAVESPPSPSPFGSGLIDEDDPRIVAFAAWLGTFDLHDDYQAKLEAKRLLKFGCGVEPILPRRPAAHIATDDLDDPRVVAFASTIGSLDKGDVPAFCRNIQELRRLGVRLVASPAGGSQ